MDQQKFNELISALQPGRLDDLIEDAHEDLHIAICKLERVKDIVDNVSHSYAETPYQNILLDNFSCKVQQRVNMLQAVMNRVRIGLDIFDITEDLAHVQEDNLE